MERVLAGRAVIEEYQAAHAKLHEGGWFDGIAAAHTPLVEKMMSDLATLGFASHEEFTAANEAACYAELQRCYRAVGTCDGCKGREKGCFSKCYVGRTDSVGLERVSYRWSDFYDWQHFEGHSPPGCSMHFEKVAEPAFDLAWGMPKGIEPGSLERAK